MFLLQEFGKTWKKAFDLTYPVTAMFTGQQSFFLTLVLLPLRVLKGLVYVVEFTMGAD